MTLPEQYAHDYRDMAMCEEELRKMLEEFAEEIRKEVGQELIRVAKGKRKPLVHDVNWAEGYNLALITMKKHITSITGIE